MTLGICCHDLWATSKGRYHPKRVEFYVYANSTLHKDDISIQPYMEYNFVFSHTEEGGGGGGGGGKNSFEVALTRGTYGPLIGGGGGPHVACRIQEMSTSLVI